MQFVGGKDVAVFVLLVSGAVAVGFGSGLLVGRQFPAHYFERFGNSSYLLDSATGKVCDLGPFNGSKEAANPSGTSSVGLDFYKSLSLNPGYPPPCSK